VWIDKGDFMKIIGVIPARYASSRFPGKPLADIHGKPMIWWVYQQAMKVPELDEVYVATDDERIYTAVEEFGGKVIMTSNKHQTGTDRVAEVAEKIVADWYVNIQGDEPLIEPETIRSVLSLIINGTDYQVVNLMTKIKDPVDVINSTVVKVIVGESGHVIYLTRSMSPYPKGSIDYNYCKHLGIYAITSNALMFFKNQSKGKLEKIEDIEMLRFIENLHFVKCIEVNSNSVAVDTENDLKKVRDLLS